MKYSLKGGTSECSRSSYLNSFCRAAGAMCMSARMLVHERIRKNFKRELLASHTLSSALQLVYRMIITVFHIHCMQFSVSHDL